MLSSSFRKTICLRKLTTFVPATRKKLKPDGFVTESFSRKANDFLIILKGGIEPMLDENPSFSLSLTENELTLNTGPRGPFIISIDNKLQRLNFQSPISGAYQYVRVILRPSHSDCFLNFVITSISLIGV